MGTTNYNCGCSITRSMFGSRAITDVQTCVWHRYLYDEDKTPKQLAKDIDKLPRNNNNCFNIIHYSHRLNMQTGFAYDPTYKCFNCGHTLNDGVYAENNDGWIPNPNTVVTHVRSQW